MNLSKRIRQLRTEKGLTQQELADRLVVSRSTIAGYETDTKQPSYDVLVKMSYLFNVSTDYLLGKSDKKMDNDMLEWRYPTAHNRLGTILKKYRNIENLTIQDFAQRLNISKDLLIDLENGIYSPSINLIQRISSVTNYDIDYITGATNNTKYPYGKMELFGQMVDVERAEGNSHFHSRFEEYCINYPITQENVQKVLGLTYEEYSDISFNRMPTLSEILRISYAFNVSVDYLIGKTDTPFSNLSKDELELILNYRDCIDVYKKLIKERAEKLSLESTDLLSKTTDETKTGTDSSGK